LNTPCWRSPKRQSSLAHFFGQDRKVNLARLWSSFHYALAGLRQTARQQQNFRIHLVIAAGAVLLALLLGLSALEWAILLLTIGVVLAAELFNSALEAIVDLVSPGQHPLAGVAKDAAAGAVFVLALAAIGIGLALFLPHLLLIAAKVGQ